MLHPQEIGRIVTAARKHERQFVPVVAGRPQSASAGRLSAPGSARGTTTPGKPATRTIQSAPTPTSGTGINPWWRYQELDVPGDGRAMINVGSGNLVLQDDDMNVAHKGIALAFRRTYNSQSRHDVSASDSTGLLWDSPGMYGNGWTNTFDAHLTRTTDGTAFYVTDIDGTRYDFGVSNDVPAPVAGNHTTLASDGSCGFLWTKKSGTTYYFYRPKPEPVCTNWPASANGTIAGYAGRLYQIVGRNSNINLTFTYSWDNGDASATGKISAISVRTESGLTATLSFADFAGHRLLRQLTFPNGSPSVLYDYDSAGNLTNVLKASNNAAGVQPLQQFGYQTLGTSSVIQWASSPRWCASGCAADGAFTAFGFSGTEQTTSTVNGIAHGAVINPSIPDGTTSTVLQSGYPTGAVYYLYDYFTTGVSTPTFRDTAGHATNWVVDGLGRPTQTQECRAAVNQVCNPNDYLMTNESWDADDNLVNEVDPRGAETDYAYDLHGNTVAVGAPAPSSGSFRPTSLYSYDQYDNVVAYCDPNATHALQADWTAAPVAPVPGQGGLCPAQSTLATRFQWNASPDPTHPVLSYEVFGELIGSTAPVTAASAPNGYQKTYAYDLAPQGGVDYGLPTSVTGASITQNDPVTPSRQPRQSFWYDASGNLVCYGTGNGQWLLGYDALGRVTSVADPDDSASGAGTCGKTGAQAGWNTTVTKGYYDDGSLKWTQTASQAANGISTTYTYDLDGNEKTETHHYGCAAVASCSAGVTQKFYDGAERLVEVELPYDANDIQGYPMMTRYIYDLSQGGTTQYQNLGLRGYGNLVKTQELLSGTVITPFTYATYTSFTPYPLSSGTWTDVRGTSFDGLDRALSSYEAAFSSQPKVANTYDGPPPGGGAPQVGLLSSVALATNEVKQYTYDAMGRLTDTAYANDNGATSPVHVRYDAGSHPISRGTDTLGNETLQYDGAGEVISLTEPAALGSATLSYDYYADGTRKDLGFASSVYTANPLYQYTYRPDGRRSSLKLNNGSSFTWTYTQAGRLQSQTDPFTGRTITPDNYYTVGKGATRYPYYRSPLTYVPETYTYDSYGRTTGVTLPAGVFSQSTTGFDLEDGVTGTSGRSVQSPNSVTTVACATSNIRNEKLPTLNGGCGGLLYNGAQFALQPDVLPNNQTSVAPWTLDARAGMLMSWQGAMEPSGNASSSQFTHDASGRLISDVEQLDRLWRPSDGTMAGNEVFSTGTRTKTYDAENRLRSQQTSWATGATYPLWGENNPGGYWNDVGQGSIYELQGVDYNANSHPVRFAATNTPDGGIPQSPLTLIWLWDGNDVVAQCSYANSSTQCGGYAFPVEGLGTYSPTTGYVAVNDRSLAGQIISSHDADGFSGMKPTGRNSRNYFIGGIIASAAPGSVSPDTNTGPDTHGSLPSTKVALDGWTLDNNTWQGVRTYDASVGQWTTPDAYAGDVHDPMTQKPFMWNRNNPYAYTDPSGYETGEISAKFSPGNVSDAKITGGEEFKRALSEFTDAAALVIFLLAERGAASNGSGDAAADAKLSEAIQARDALAQRVVKLGGRPPAVVTAGYNRLTGKVVAACSGGRTCAERHVENDLGVDPSLIQFTKAIRPRTGQEQPICLGCQQRYSQSQFPPGTQFVSP